MGRSLRRRHLVARERDPVGPSHPEREVLHERVQVAAVRDEPQGRALVQEQGQHGPRRPPARLSHRVPEMRREARAGIERRFRRQVVCMRVADGGDDPRFGQPLDRDERERELRRQGDEADQIGGPSPLGDRAEIDRRQFLHRYGSRRLRVEERPFQMEAQTEWILDRGDVARGEQVARDPARRQPFRLVDLQVDEARKDERLLRSPLPPLDRDDDSVLDHKRPGEGTLDRVNEKSL